MRERSRTVAAKLPHICGQVDKILIVRRVNLESDPLFRNLFYQKQETVTALGKPETLCLMCVM